MGKPGVSESNPIECVIVTPSPWPWSFEHCQAGGKGRALKGGGAGRQGSRERGRGLKELGGEAVVI